MFNEMKSAFGGKTLILTLLLFTFPQAYSQWQPDVRMTNDPAISQTSPNNAWNIASTGDTVYIVWFDGRDGNDEIYFKRSTNRGVSWGADTRLTNIPSYSQYPTVSVSGQIVYVAWQELNPGNWEIYFKRSTDAGSTWGADTRLSFDNANSWNPSITVSETIVHVLWHDSRNGNMEIYYRRSPDAGISWGAETRLSSTSGDSWMPSCAVSGSIVHAFWIDNTDGNFEVYYKRSTDYGLSWGSNIRLTNNPGLSNVPSVAINGTVMHLIWSDDRDGNAEVYYKRSTDLGLNWGSDTRVTNNSGTSEYTSVAVSGVNVHALWEDNRDGNWEIYYKRSTDGGAGWEADTRLTNAAGDSRIPTMSVSGTVVHVVWHDERDGNREIYYKRNPNGGSPANYLNILSHYPLKNALNIPPSSNITIQFNANVNTSTLTSSNIRLYGSQSGLHNSNITFNTANNTATINPNTDFRIGEIIEVIVTQRVKSMTNDSLEKPYSWRFYTDVTLGATSYLLDTSISANSISGSIFFDCDNDGDLDAASNSHDGATITIYKNDGTGRFSTFTTLTGGGLAYTTYPMSCGDFNSDGNIDLAVPVRFSNIISVWFGTGTGNFTPAQQVGVNYEPQSVDIADFNGDGYLDMVACCNNISNFYYDILMNDRTGHFSRTQQVNVANRPDICTTGDVDGDGDIDILTSVAVTSSSNCYILFNNGIGFFTVSQIQVTNASYIPTPGDLDGDGDLDLIVNGSTSSAVNGIKVLMNNGTGTFTAGQSFGNQTLTYGPKYLRDINNDGYLDLVATIGGTLEIYTNNGTGTFSSYITLANNGWPGYSIGIGDINGNGNMEICTPGYTTASVFNIYKAYPLVGIINNEIPTSYFIKQNYPNPFNPVTKLEFGIERSGFVQIIIYDVLGREISYLVNERLKPGTYEADWDGTNYPSGMYFYKLIAGQYVKTRKMVFVK